MKSVNKKYYKQNRNIHGFHNIIVYEKILKNL